MRDYTLGQGIRLQSLDLVPSFPFVAGRASLTIPDPLFPEIVGSLFVCSGPNSAARTTGATAMSATARCTALGSGFLLGFKQLASFSFQTAIYAGLKDSDGSIEESSTGLNFRLFLDVSPTDSLTAPWAPFYLPPYIVTRNGESIRIEMIDQPARRYRLVRPNSVSGKRNFLLSVRTKCDFVTFVVAELPSGSHVPVEGFSWRYHHDVDLNWKGGTPSIASDFGRVEFDSRIPSLTPGDPRQRMLTDGGLHATDSIVFKFNKAMHDASHGAPTGDYQIRENAAYSENVSAIIAGRINKDFF